MAIQFIVSAEHFREYVEISPQTSLSDVHMLSRNFLVFIRLNSGFNQLITAKNGTILESVSPSVLIGIKILEKRYNQSIQDKMQV